MESEAVFQLKIFWDSVVVSHLFVSHWCQQNRSKQPLLTAVNGMNEEFPYRPMFGLSDVENLNVKHNQLDGGL